MSLYEELMKKAQEERYKLTLQHSRMIQKLYQDVADDIQKELKGMKGTSRAYRNQYMKVVRQRLRHLNKEIEEAVRKGVNLSSEKAVEVNRKWFEEIGHKYNIDIPKEMYNSLFSIPQKEIDTILNGDLYKTGIGISENIWRYSKEYEKNVNYILAKGIAEKKSYRELAEELSGYARGNNTSYKAMRLIRTSMNHAFQLSCIDNAKKNPFAEAIHWNLSAQHYIRQVKRFGKDICDEYANQDNYKLGTGNFPKGDIPVAHPNCMCYLTTVIPKSLDEIADELNDWLKNGGNTPLNEYINNKGNISNNVERNSGYNRGKEGYNNSIDNEVSYAFADKYINNIFENKVDLIAPRNIFKELNKSKVGKDTIEYIVENNVEIEMFYHNVPEDKRGICWGTRHIEIYVPNTKTKLITAQTIIHEITHLKYDIRHSRWAEAICFLKELEHIKTIDSKDKKEVVKIVNKLYSHLPWRSDRDVKKRI